MLSEIWKAINNKWRPLSFEEKNYMAGMVCFGVGFIALLIFDASVAFSVPTLIGIGCFVVGFTAWCIDIYRSSWMSQIKGAVFYVFHGLVGFVSLISARALVGLAIGMPAKDFDFTVLTFGVVLYPAVLMVVIFVVLLLGCALSFIAVVNASFLNSSSHIPIIGLHPSLQEKLNAWELARNKFVSKVSSKMVGALATAVVIVFLVSSAYDPLFKHPNLVRLVSYFADYQYARAYPGVEPGKKFLLHENGVVSYAELDGWWDVRITVGKFKENNATP